VTSSGNLISNLLNGTLNLLESLLGIKSIEPDQLLAIPQKPISNIPPGTSHVFYSVLRNSPDGALRSLLD
jgi:hypothetical protein